MQSCSSLSSSSGLPENTNGFCFMYIWTSKYKWKGWVVVVSAPVLAREHCRISPPHFLAECRRRRLNQASFVLLCFALFAFYPRDAMLARVITIATCLSVRPSVCPSVTRWYCVKTKKASVMIFSPSGSPKTLVFWSQISSPNSKGFPQNGGLKQGSVGKI